VTPETLIVAVLILGFSLIVFGVAVGSAIGDGIVASKAVESIARQPEAAATSSRSSSSASYSGSVPDHRAGAGLLLFFVVANVPSLVARC